MTIRVTITQPGVTNAYGIAMAVGTTYTVEEDFGRSLIAGLKATDTDGYMAIGANSAFSPGVASRTMTASGNMASDDDDKTVTYNSGSVGTLTIPSDAIGNWRDNAVLVVYIAGAGVPVFAAGAGVTLRSPAGLAGGVQYGFITAVRVGPNEWTQL